MTARVIHEFLAYANRLSPPQEQRGHRKIILDGFAKSPSVPRGAGLRFIFRHCGVSLWTPHSSRFARLVPPVAGELFTVPSTLATSYEVINLFLTISGMIWSRPQADGALIPM